MLNDYATVGEDRLNFVCIKGVVIFVDHAYQERTKS